MLAKEICIGMKLGLSHEPGIFLNTMCILALGPTQPPIQWATWALYLGGKVARV